MKITDIIHKKGNRCEIYIDGEAAAVIDLSLLSVTKGETVSPETAEEIISLGKKTAALESAMRSLTAADFSKKALFRRLRQKGIDEEAAGEAVKTVSEAGIISDERVALRLIGAYSGEKHFGRRRVAEELFKRGIEKELSDALIEEHALPDGENARLFAKSKRLCEKTDKNIAALIRAGYSYEDIRGIFERDE